MADPYDPDVVDGALGAAVDMPLRQILASLHYAYPTIVFVYYMATSTVAVCTLQTRSSEQAHPRRRAITWLLMFVILTYFAQLVVLAIHAAVRHIFPVADQDTVIGLMSCALVFGVVFAGLSEATNPVWYAYLGPFGIALVVEPVLETLALMVRPAGPPSIAEILDMSAVASRYLAVVFAWGFYFEGTRTARHEKGTDSERQSLLKANGNGNGNGNACHDSDSDEQSEGTAQQNGYGTTSDASTEATDSNQSSDTENDDDNPYERRQRKASEQMEKRLKEKGNWVTYAKSFLVRVRLPRQRNLVN